MFGFDLHNHVISSNSSYTEKKNTRRPNSQCESPRSVLETTMNHPPPKYYSSARPSTSPCSLLTKLLISSAEELEVSIEGDSELEAAEDVVAGEEEENEDNGDNGSEEEECEDDDEEEKEEEEEAVLESSIFSASLSFSSVSSYGGLKKNFLSSCCLCNGPISQGRDIYMYR